LFRLAFACYRRRTRGIFTGAKRPVLGKYKSCQGYQVLQQCQS
jgi:hypothetical protein